MSNGDEGKYLTWKQAFISFVASIISILALGIMVWRLHIADVHPGALRSEEIVAIVETKIAITGVEIGHLKKSIDNLRNEISNLRSDLVQRRKEQRDGKF